MDKGASYSKVAKRRQPIDALLNAWTAEQDPQCLWLKVRLMVQTFLRHEGAHPFTHVKQVTLTGEGEGEDHQPKDEMVSASCLYTQELEQVLFSFGPAPSSSFSDYLAQFDSGPGQGQCTAVWGAGAIAYRYLQSRPDSSL